LCAPRSGLLADAAGPGRVPRVGRRRPSTGARKFAKPSQERGLTASASRAIRGDPLKYLLLLVPCVIALWAPLYNFVSPELLGVPFFYWFQLLLIAVSAFTIYLFDRIEKA
jgi:Protein of unknown function (DUF3311)